ncbi:MAG: hypothetical protein CL927_09630 [Deltaproteobacteria bacterium]|nr:hypothetical protein [Deltaproteobacteria bacterium]HCH64863.1 hypothetical protein [Deltaproteobacteria bacterium]
MVRSLTRASAAACLLGWATPAAALECDAFAALLEAEVPQPVIQAIVLESPPSDGWACLDDSPYAVADLQMSGAFRDLEPTRELSWQARFKQCDAGRSLRRRAHQLFSDDADAPDSTRTVSCRRAAALREAVAADVGV